MRARALPSDRRERKTRKRKTFEGNRNGSGSARTRQGGTCLETSLLSSQRDQPGVVVDRQ